MTKMNRVQSLVKFLKIIFGESVMYSVPYQETILIGYKQPTIVDKDKKEPNRNKLTHSRKIIAIVLLKKASFVYHSFTPLF